jgi:DNA repair photolyase
MERSQKLQEREKLLREMFYTWLKTHDKKVRLELVKKYNEISGVSQWSDMSYNILKPTSACYNDCKYCYVKPMFRRFRIGGDRDVTLNPELDDIKVNKGWRSNVSRKVIMFPTSHDIFPSMVESYIKVCRGMIRAGHTVLCVSKPRFECITKICDELINFKHGIFFRFTIGSMDNEVLKKWEPNAPPFEERLECLKYAFDKGYQTSISMEPILDDKTKNVVSVVRPYVTEKIWIGLMTQVPSEDIEDLCFEKDGTKMSYLIDLVRHYDNDKTIMWKKNLVKYMFDNKTSVML